MPQLRRSRYFVVLFEDEPIVDLAALLRGRVDTAQETYVSAVSSVTGAEHRITTSDLEILSRVPSGEWSPRSRLAAEHGVHQETLDDLATKGLLISDADDPEAARLRQREERLEASAWHPASAFYHLMASRPGGLRDAGEAVVDVAEVAAGSQESTDRHVARWGPPPPAFHEVAGDGESVPLPAVGKEGGLYRALTERKTVRAFDRSTPMEARDLAALLYWVFGCHGTAKMTKGVSILRRTSPSGGSLHPLEVYPLVQNVAGVGTGLYHYRARDHSLSRIRELEGWEAESLAVGMAAGQDFAASAHVLLLMTARFSRNFWKYRRNARTYGVVLQDAGHLSQTLYLVGAELGLGAFYAAFDGPFVEEALGLDGVEEGTVGLAGCGILPPAGVDDYSLDFFPYTPGDTQE